MVDAAQAMLAALEQLERRLQQAKARFDTSGRGGREGAIVAVGAAIEFVLRVDRLRDQDLAVPLAVLMGALNDLDDGRQAEILTPATFSNRHPDDWLTRSIHAHAAATLELLMRQGFGRDEAAAHIARSLKRAGFRFGQRRGDPKNTVINWRAKLNTEKAARFDADQYRDLLESVEIISSDRAAVRRDLLARLEHLVKAFRAA